MAEYTGENWPTVRYGENGIDGPIFYRVCPVCSAFVKPDNETHLPENQTPNATCKRHGRVTMPFCCWASDIEEADNG